MKRLFKKPEPSSVYLNTIHTLAPGTHVQVAHDHGPPGFEHISGWRNVNGIVVPDEDADSVEESVAVEHPLFEIPLLGKYFNPADNTMPESLVLIWYINELVVL